MIYIMIYILSSIIVKLTKTIYKRVEEIRFFRKILGWIVIE
jgi:hypothetical protein